MKREHLTDECVKVNAASASLTLDIAKALGRLEPPRATEGRVCWRMNSAVVREGDWHEVSYDVDDGWDYYLGPLAPAAAPEHLQAYASDARDLGYTLFHLMGQGNPL